MFADGEGQGPEIGLFSQFKMYDNRVSLKTNRNISVFLVYLYGCFVENTGLYYNYIVTICRDISRNI